MPVQKLNRAIKYRAYPTSEQQVLFAKTFGCVRFIWNHMLIDAQQFLDEAGTFFVPTPAKYKKEFPFLKEVDSLALANTQLDLKDANKRHLESPKAVGVPRLKSKHRSGMSYTTNNKKTQSKDGKIKNTVYVVGNLVHLPKVPTTNRSSMWLQAVWKLWGFQSRRVISTRMTSPPSMFPSNLSAFITSF